MGSADGQQSPVDAIIVCGNYSPMTARIWPMVCILRIRFFFKDIVKYLQKSGLYWDRVCEWSAALWCCKNCLRELLADDSAHLTDGLHTADQIFLHRHKFSPPILWSGWIRNRSSSDTCGAFPDSSAFHHRSYLPSCYHTSGIELMFYFYTNRPA